MQAYAERHEHRLFVVAGGVAANSTIRRTLEATAAKHGFDFLAPPMAYCTDNAAMIALAGAERLALGLTSDIDASARPRWPAPGSRSTGIARPTNWASGSRPATPWTPSPTAISPSSFWPWPR